MDLAEWMADAGLDDDGLALKARVSRSTISRIRRKKSRPSLALAPVLADLSGGRVGLHELLGLPAGMPAPAEAA